MRKHPIATVINFCTNEARFIQSCLEQALIFSQQVIVPISTHFFDGTLENRACLEEIYRAFPECQFVEYPFAPKKVKRSLLKSVGAEHFWHCVSRIVGFSCVDEEIETILFLDADEVPEGKKFQEWLDGGDYRQYAVLKLANYWYFREPRYRAEKLEDSVILAQKKVLTSDVLIHPNERCALYEMLPHPKRRMVTGVDGLPLVHHFSWVRTQEEMLKKVKSWGHKKDRNWEELVTKEFNAPFQGTDFVHGYPFQEVVSPFPICLEPPSFTPRGKRNVRKFKEEEFSDLIHSKKTSFWRSLISLDF
jgi:hypothetical protein